ncbi:MAG: radical SAM protein [candidate division WOR-3 bacterium]|nr:MAG: radical SAM protein [candidate division WOR-3 bacterium]
MPQPKKEKEKFLYLYGPVPSRRLGLSLGIDIVPHKNCSYDCIYCQLGTTDYKTTSRKEYTPVRGILEEIKTAVANKQRIDYITFSGSGEPTLHSGIGRIIDGVKKMTSIPTAVLTNGSLLHQSDVRNDLIHASVVLPTLCTVNQEMFIKIHRSVPQLDIMEIVRGYIDFRRMFKGLIWLELMIIKGINDKPEHITGMRSVIEEIAPDRIHLNTVARPPSEDYAEPVTAEVLERIKAMLGSKCEIIAEFRPPGEGHGDGDPSESILSIIQRRPVTIEDLIEVSGLTRGEIIERIEQLMKEGTVISSIHGDRRYYRT